MANHSKPLDKDLGYWKVFKILSKTKRACKCQLANGIIVRHPPPVWRGMAINPDDCVAPLGGGGHLRPQVFGA